MKKGLAFGQLIKALIAIAVLVLIIYFLRNIEVLKDMLFKLLSPKGL